MALSKEERYRRNNLRRATEEFKEYRREYDRKRQQNPEYVERQKLLRKSPRRKASAAIASKKYRSTQEYRDWKKLYRASPEQQQKRREYEFKRKFGITPADYDRMLVEQGGVCAICGQEETFELKGAKHSLAVDHCHKTGKIRGLLCRNCNQALGLAKDNVTILESAIKYLKRNV